MERKLASIQQVLDIIPILGADAIELVKINGWQCVVKKGAFQVGDKGVFFEIDSVPPNDEEFRFLWHPRGQVETWEEKPYERPANFRIKTIKLRGALSQGLFMPLHPLITDLYKVGDDVTEEWGVTKYEAPETGCGIPSTIRSTFPTHLIPKTDETRIQSYPKLLDELRGKPYVMTLKLDGSSATFLIDPQTNEFQACSRNQICGPDSAFYKIAEKYKIENVLRGEPQYVIQGELCGPGIQQNRLGLTENELFVFNVYDMNKAQYLDTYDAESWCWFRDLPFVPIEQCGDSFDETVDSLLMLAEGRYENTNNEREGLVIRPQFETYSETLRGRLSFKVISNRYLLKGGE